MEVLVEAVTFLWFSEIEGRYDATIEALHNVA
ncbi:hypothetical protein SAMN05216554_2395 [Herbiconiux ginsengi]|uniref:Uncharacterized protein n=1 Tax=Herbiconiux ginsengi TaxID=381665 RepID=A0A1H3QAE2_9MICO|nr:hypothetical protein SAMN05216554_2395 [Herbiconiux ginsengi]